ncbi:methyltransferase [Planomonospora parontospora]|uniref:methyltransferase n=1 Tax=Planomonospora parontospora TaxID=58119 RepID=UPI00166FC79F|nr:methyltransferase [Planomonospora parontospora]GGL51454.1 methyltransferase [Planomonospora parontospora subsp. antibiotica]GII19109.1 methyltransferase [Planomonospora parontospora subsp. antibiotica]
MQEAAHALVARHREITTPRTFRLLGMEWDLLPGVYAPHLSQSSALYAEWLPYPLYGSFCEVGSGTGYVSVLAALRGCASVTALDVSGAAAENTRLNAGRHGVASVVRVACGDMFDPLTCDDKFDVIYWNSNFVEGEPADALERAFFDPGYVTHAAFFRGAAAHLEAGGRLLLGFTDLGDERRVHALAAEHGWRAALLRAAKCAAGNGHIEYRLLEFTRAG